MGEHTVQIHVVCVLGFTFLGWGSEASPGISRSPAFGESPTWWTLGVYASPISKPEHPWTRVWVGSGQLPSWLAIVSKPKARF